MNKQGKSGIEWTDYTWNPISGCKNDCWYCYGKQIRKRFVPNVPWTELVVYPARFKEPKKLKKPSKIFVESMSDIAASWFPDVWREQIMTAIDAAPQHTYQFLTKSPKNYFINEWRDGWFGYTRTEGEIDICPPSLSFVSCEPLLGEIYLDCMVDWVIIGAMTGWGKQYWPKIEWIESILRQCDDYSIPVFMKKNLKCVWTGKLRQEWPILLYDSTARRQSKM